MARLANKVAVVTGAANGMGEATARLFVAQGARVLLADIDEPRGRALAEELGEPARFVSLDVSKSEDWANAMAVADQAFGGLHILVNNAGYFSTNSLQKATREEFERHVAVNQIGVLLGMQAAAGLMARGGGGSIVNISSSVGLRGGAGAISYRSAKWAVRGLSRWAAQDLASSGVRVNSVHPGPIDTRMINAGHTEAEKAAIMNLTLMKRLGQPNEVANAILFLASDEASYITGAELVVDGGSAA